MGEPVAKGRPRFGRTRLGHVTVYSPQKTQDYEALLRNEAIKAMGDQEPFDGAIGVTIKAFFAIPKSKSAKAKEIMDTGHHRVLKKPDIDNIQKSVLDAFNGVVFKDDCMVWSIHAVKLYSSEPRIDVFVVCEDNK